MYVKKQNITTGNVAFAVLASTADDHVCISLGCKKPVEVNYEEKTINYITYTEKNRKCEKIGRRNDENRIVYTHGTYMSTDC